MGICKSLHCPTGNHRRKPQKPLKFDTTRTVPTCKSIAGNLKPGFLSRTSCDSIYSTLFSQEGAGRCMWRHSAQGLIITRINLDLKRQLEEHKPLLDEAHVERNKADDLCSSRLREIQDMELQIKKRTVAFIASHTKLQGYFDLYLRSYSCSQTIHHQPNDRLISTTTLQNMSASTTRRMHLTKHWPHQTSQQNS